MHARLVKQLNLFYANILMFLVHRCNHLSPLANQFMSCPFPDDFIYGSTCSFVCMSGFVLEGSPTIICEKVTGNNEGTMYQWSGAQPTCVGKYFSYLLLKSSLFPLIKKNIHKIGIQISEYSFKPSSE